MFQFLEFLWYKTTKQVNTIMFSLNIWTFQPFFFFHDSRLFKVKVNGYSSMFSAILSYRDKCSDFQFASLDRKTLQKEDLLSKGRNCVFLLKSETKMKELLPLKVYPFTFRCEDTRSGFSTNFTKGNNFREFLFASQGTRALLNIAELNP